MKTVAAILAGGKGSRFGGDIPKQFVKAGGKTIIEYTIQAFEDNELIDEICVVAGADYVDLAKEIINRAGFSKVKAVIAGGKERYDSSLNAIKLYEGQDVNILIHDAARPKVDQRIITRCALALYEYEAVCTAYPATDTIAVSDSEGEFIREIPKRSLMYQVQTPQGFRLETIRRAYEKAFMDPDFAATDDCGVVRKYLPEVDIKIITGSSENIKITRAEDLRLL